MNIRIEPLEEPSRDGLIYAKVVYINMIGGEETIIRGTLDYCLSWAEGQDKEAACDPVRIENAKELLFWLHRNCSMKGA